jgi:methionine synthase II (cobalamin-independent)
LNELVAVIHEQNACAGLHCCGNTDWSIIMDTEIDVISFDAYNYGESITLYPDKLATYLSRGGILAYGIVPSEEKVVNETVESLINRLSDLFILMERKGIDQDKVRNAYIITPSCGVGSLPVSLAERVLDLTKEVGNKLKV